MGVPIMTSSFVKGIALAVTVGVVATAASALASTYVDTNRHWAAKQINALSEKNVFVGYGDNYFKPNALITRAEFVSALMKALGANGSSAGNKYNDVSDAQWTTPFINQADAKKLIEGYGEKDFQPKRAINRGEALAILSKVTLGETLSEAKTEQLLKSYRDGYRVPEWNKEAVAKTINYDIFRSDAKGYNVINPTEKITRGEAAYLIYNLLNHNDIARQEQIEVHHKWAKVVPEQTIQFPQGIDHRRTKSTYTTTVATPISSEFNTVGDKVTLVLNEEWITPNGVTILPGSKVYGQITEVRPASWNQTAAVNIGFDKVVTPDGKTYDVEGTIATNDGFLHGDNNPVKVSPQSSFEALKSQIKYESGAHSRYQREQVFYQNPTTTDQQANVFVDENLPRFVLVGVGDKLELNFTGPAMLQN